MKRTHHTTHFPVVLLSKVTGRGSSRAVACALLLAVAPTTRGWGDTVDVYLLGGQSNMDGNARVTELPAELPRAVPNAFFQFGATWMPLNLEQVRVAGKKGYFGPEFGFALDMATKERPVYLIKYAASGMALHHGWHAGRWDGGDPAPRRRNFYPGESPADENQGTLYRGLLRKIQAGIDLLEKQGHTPVVRGFAWMQGEQDSKQEASATSYAESLARLQRRLVQDLGLERGLPMVFGQVLPHDPADARFTHRDEIRAEMVKAGKTLAQAKMIPTDDCEVLPDRVHYNAAGQLRLGKAFAQAIRGLHGPMKQQVHSTGSKSAGAQPGAIVEHAFTTIPAFFKAHCSKCHNAEKKKGGINFTEYTRFRLENAEHWQDVIHNLQRGDMPPEEAAQPSEDNRRRFLSAVCARLDRLYADSGKRDFRFTRLTNEQIAWSLRDLLRIDRDFSGDLIQDPVGKHGESLQSSLEQGAGHMELYLNALERALALAIPDLDHPPTSYQLHGNDWEQQHYLNRNDLAHGPRRKHKRYRGPQWLGDDFEVPVPPNHFFRIYIDDNRSEGAFRVRVHIRNEAPQNGGDLARHEFSVFFDKGFKSAMHTVGHFTVEPKPGTQVFELFGNVYDFPGVDPAPVPEGEDPYGIMAHFHYRFLTVQNCSPLRSPSNQAVNNPDWVVRGDAHFIRADDRWMDAWGAEFGRTNWLKPSHGGSDHTTRGKPSVYKAVMKDTSYAVIERITFDLPWQWPPAGIQPYLEKGRLSDASITRGVREMAVRAWRRPLTGNETREFNALIAARLKRADTKTEALRDLLMAVLADSRFLFYSDVEEQVRIQNFERVARLAGFLWCSVPDTRLLQLANRDTPLSDTVLATEVGRMIADPRSERFVADFTSDWMAFTKFDQIAINPNYYRQWNPKFKDYIRQEPIAFLSSLLHEDLSCLNCLSSDFVVVNDMMAKYYGLPTPDSGHRFSRVPAPEGRGGVLTQAAFLLAHGDGEDAHAVNRGVWVRGRLLGDPPRDPPPEVPALTELDKKDPSAAGRSTRDRLSLHRSGVCYDCHRDIDPWGVAMETYGATGLLRERILRLSPEAKVKKRSLPVVDQATIRGQAVAGMDALQGLLMEQHADDFARGFSASLFSYALGRPLSYREDAALAELAAHFKQHDYRMDELIEAIVLRPEFHHPNGAER